MLVMIFKLKLFKNKAKHISKIFICCRGYIKLTFEKKNFEKKIWPFFLNQGQIRRSKVKYLKNYDRRLTLPPFERTVHSESKSAKIFILAQLLQKLWGFEKWACRDFCAIFRNFDLDFWPNRWSFWKKNLDPSFGS